MGWVMENRNGRKNIGIEKIAKSLHTLCKISRAIIEIAFMNNDSWRMPGIIFSFSQKPQDSFITFSFTNCIFGCNLIFSAFSGKLTFLFVVTRSLLLIKNTKYQFHSIHKNTNFSHFYSSMIYEFLMKFYWLDNIITIYFVFIISFSCLIDFSPQNRILCEALNFLFS